MIFRVAFPRHENLIKRFVMWNPLCSVTRLLCVLSHFPQWRRGNEVKSRGNEVRVSLDLLSISKIEWDSVSLSLLYIYVVICSFSRFSVYFYFFPIFLGFLIFFSFYLFIYFVLCVWFSFIFGIVIIIIFFSLI